MAVAQHGAGAGQCNRQEGLWDHRCTRRVYQASAASPRFCRATWHRRQGGRERREEDKGCEQKCWGEGVGELDIKHTRTHTPRKMSHGELSSSSSFSSFFFISLTFPVSPCEGGGAQRNYRNAAGVFPTCAPV